MLRNIGQVFNKYQSMPVETFMEPFIKQVKTRESKSYFINIFDIEFIQIVAGHRKLGIATALELFDLLAKTKLNSHSFAGFTDEAMGILLDRFLTLDEDNIFFDYVHSKQYSDSKTCKDHNGNVLLQSKNQKAIR